MRFVNQLIGLVLILVGVYFLGQNIVFTTHSSPYWWRDVSATGSVLSLVGGIIALIFFPRQTRGWAWILIALGIVLVFLSGSVLLKPTSLWYFFAAFASLIAGLKLFTTGQWSSF
ncbi:MAG: hypothetical protein SW833_19915 [Cyanobacteriota bacterium]|nr:hypothetical protein [Cyanobacteriota bacterium]